MRIASLFLIACLGALAACGGKSKAAEPTTNTVDNAGGDTGGDEYAGSSGGYEDDKEPCEEAQPE